MEFIESYAKDKTNAIPHVVWSFKLIIMLNHYVGKLFKFSLGTNETRRFTL